MSTPKFYRESEGYLSGDAPKDPKSLNSPLGPIEVKAEITVSDDPAPASIVITPADLQEAIAQADKDPGQRQQAMDKIQAYLNIARPSAPDSREVKYFTRELKRLQNAAT
ncbi:MAG: hypothetical protein IV090_24520 [Candidatus Sericytochromatia bacterium]|nr:hypothetical protein [Candidatus Sericytochromatia bacterium]